VTDVKPGDRVAYAMARGSHAEYAVVPAWQLMPVPEGVDAKTAAGVMLQGMTAHYLTSFHVSAETRRHVPGERGRGRRGTSAGPDREEVGATVIGMVSTEHKGGFRARGRGGSRGQLHAAEFPPEVKRLTEGRGADVFYDSVGKDTFLPGFDCLRPRGMMVTYGNASGPVPEIAPLVLNQKGSLFLTRPTLAHYAATKDELAWRSGDLFRWLKDGTLQLRIERVYKTVRHRSGADRSGCPEDHGQAGTRAVTGPQPFRSPAIDFANEKVDAYPRHTTGERPVSDRVHGQQRNGARYAGHRGVLYRSAVRAAEQGKRWRAAPS
jgi:NADPH:quinone reductase-like Zn-dependent oxidoreductase